MRTAFTEPPRSNQDIFGCAQNDDDMTNLTFFLNLVIPRLTGGTTSLHITFVNFRNSIHHGFVALPFFLRLGGHGEQVH
jgi:hypothetical protein